MGGNSTLVHILAVVVVASAALAGCTQAPTQTDAVPALAPVQTQITSGGFVCPAPEPRMEVNSKELDLLVWTEYIPADMQECFELVYGVKVNRDEYSSNEEMVGDLERSDKAYDLAQPTDYMVATLIRKGMVQPLDPGRLLNLKNMDPNYMNLSFDPGNKYSVPYEAGTDAIAVNTKTVDELPASWSDLWKPEYAGRMVFIDDSRVVIGMALLTLGYDVNTTDPAQLAEAKAKLEQLIPNIMLIDSDSPRTALIAGDVDLGVVWTGEAFLASQEKPEIHYIYPSEGAFLWQDNWVMPKDAPHVDAAYAWMNYAMQGNIFWMMLRDFPYNNPNKAALEFAKVNQPDLYNAYMDSPITNVPPQVIQAGHRIEDVGTVLPVYEQIWAQLKGE